MDADQRPEDPHIEENVRVFFAVPGDNRPLDQIFAQQQEQEPVRPGMRTSGVPYASPFPIGTPFKIDGTNSSSQAAPRGYDELTWTVFWDTVSAPKEQIKRVRISIKFHDIQDKTFKIYFRARLPDVNLDYRRATESMAMIDAHHDTLVFPECQFFAVARYGEQRQPIVNPEFNIVISIEHIEYAEAFTLHNQIWPLGCHWVSYDGKAVRMDTTALRILNANIDKLRFDMATKIFSQKEADAFFEFSALLFHQWFQGIDMFARAFRNGLKLGFTSDWWEWWNVQDTVLGFQTRTLLPFYQTFLIELPAEPLEYVHNAQEEKELGTIEQFPIRLNYQEESGRVQIARLRSVHNSDCQLSFYLEEVLGRYILMVGCIFQPFKKSRINCIITIMHKGVARQTVRFYRIVSKDQQTINVPMRMLNEEELEELRNGDIRVAIMLYYTETPCDFFHNMSPSGYIMMPGILSGWIRCSDGVKIGVCKEYVSKYSDMANMIFNNTRFVDCGKDEMTINEPSTLVLEVLNIIYHRSQPISRDTYRPILDLAGYLLAPVVTRYVEMAVLRTDFLLPEEKMEVAITHHLDILLYIMRHPEYATDYKIVLTPELQAQVPPPTEDELDGGENGRKPRLAIGNNFHDGGPGGPGGPGGSGGPGSSGGAGGSGSSGPGGSGGSARFNDLGGSEDAPGPSNRYPGNGRNADVAGPSNRNYRGPDDGTPGKIRQPLRLLKAKEPKKVPARSLRQKVAATKEKRNREGSSIGERVAMRNAVEARNNRST